MEHYYSTRFLQQTEHVMVSDRYTKIVLTVIAAALMMIVAQNATREATAQTSQQCPAMSPCYVVNTAGVPLYIVDAAASRNAGSGLRGIPPTSGLPK